MIRYTEDELNDIFNSEKFKSEYDKYNINKSFINFLDKIENNKNYYKLTILPNIKNNKSSIIIKEILGLLNKITDMNYKKISNDIINKLDENILEIIIDNILEKCILQSTYSKYLIYIINEIHKSDKYNIPKLVKKVLAKIYTKINKPIINNTEYDELCNKNKKTDNLIGYYRIIILMDKYTIIDNDILKIIDTLINLIKEGDDQYKYIQCLYSIIDINPLLLNQMDINELKNLKEHIKTKKTLFKLLDILDIKK